MFVPKMYAIAFVDEQLQVAVLMQDSRVRPTNAISSSSSGIKKVSGSGHVRKFVVECQPTASGSDRPTESHV